jgi:hypothetical protein
MKTIAAIIIVCFAYAGTAQLWPDIRPVSFEEVASSFNTTTAKDELLSFVSGCEISFPDEGRIPYPVEINLRKPIQMDKRDLKVFCWDAAARCWKRFSSSPEIVKDNGQSFVRFTTDIAGIYSLMNMNVPKGECELTLPKEFARGKWKYIERDAGIVSEGSCSSGKMIIRKTFILPDAELHLSEVGGRGADKIIPFIGQLYSSLWRDVSTPSQTYPPDAEKWSATASVITSKK